MAFRLYIVDFDTLNYAIFTNSAVSSFLDSGVGLVLSMVYFSSSEKRFKIVKLTMWVWRIINR